MELILEVLAEDRLPALAGPRGVAPLHHESRHHAVENDSVVVSSRCERRKVL